jgi:hypothetical protein
MAQSHAEGKGRVLGFQGIAHGTQGPVCIEAIPCELAIGVSRFSLAVLPSGKLLMGKEDVTDGEVRSRRDIAAGRFLSQPVSPVVRSRTHKMGLGTKNSPKTGLRLS